MDYFRSIKGVAEDLAGRRGEIFNKGLEKMKQLGNSVVTEQTYEVEGKRYITKKLLAEGGYGYVYLVREADSGRPYAMKKMNVQGSERIKAVRNEIKVMQQLSHSKHIVRLLGHKTTLHSPQAAEIILVMDLCSGGSLLDRMNRAIPQSRDDLPPGMPPPRIEPLGEEEILKIFQQTCLGVAEMHAQNPPIAHRDIKVENVLLHESGTWKLCDFGSSTTRAFQPSNERERGEAGDDIALHTTLTYRAPEMVDLYLGQPINEKVDIWALGCLLFKAAFLVDPFGDGSLAILNCRYVVPEFHKLSERFLDLVKFCLDPDPVKRPDIHQVIAKVAQMRGVEYQRPPSAQASRPPPSSATRDPRASNPSQTAQPPAQNTPSRSANSGASIPRNSSVPGGAKNSLFDMLDWDGGNANNNSDGNHANTRVSPHKPPVPSSGGMQRSYSGPNVSTRHVSPTHVAAAPSPVSNVTDEFDLLSFRSGPAPAPVAAAPSSQVRPPLQAPSSNPLPPRHSNNLRNSSSSSTSSSASSSAAIPKNRSSNALFDMLDWEADSNRNSTPSAPQTSSSLNRSAPSTSSSSSLNRSTPAASSSADPFDPLSSFSSASTPTAPLSSSPSSGPDLFGDFASAPPSSARPLGPQMAFNAPMYPNAMAQRSPSAPHHAQPFHPQAYPMQMGMQPQQQQQFNQYASFNAYQQPQPLMPVLPTSKQSPSPSRPSSSSSSIDDFDPFAR